MCHFRQAMRRIVPAGQRVEAGAGRRLPSNMAVLLEAPLRQAMAVLRDSFSPGVSPAAGRVRGCHRPRLLLAGTRGQGQTTHLAPAIVHTLEKLPCQKLDLATLYSVSARAPEEACAQVTKSYRRG